MIYLLKDWNILFELIFLIIIRFISPYNITRLKIGIQNEKIFLSENETIYEIKTNYLHLKLIINTFENIEKTQISNKLASGSPTVKKCSSLSDFCQSE